MEKLGLVGPDKQCFNLEWPYLCFVHEKLKDWVMYQDSTVLAIDHSSQREQAIIAFSIISLPICLL